MTQLPRQVDLPIYLANRVGFGLAGRPEPDTATWIANLTWIPQIQMVAFNNKRMGERP